MDRIAIFIYKTDFFGYFLYLSVKTGIMIIRKIFLSIVLFSLYYRRFYGHFSQYFDP